MTRNATIVGLGEILWDVFAQGPRFGGAPANFACSAAGLGGQRNDVWMASGVGKDELGPRAIEALREHGVDTSCVADLDKPTGQVLVELDEQGRASYEFAVDTAWDNLQWSREWEQLAACADAVCFGTLGQRSDCSRETIQRFVAATPPSALRIFDVNLRRPFVRDDVIVESLKLANVLKLNDEELPVVGELCGLSGTDSQVLQGLARQFDLRLVALTRGPRGAVLIRGEEMSEQAVAETQVVDTVGAGDAFTAALTVGLLEGGELDAINRWACQVASYVCSQSGATPRIPNSFSFNEMVRYQRQDS